MSKKDMRKNNTSKKEKQYKLRKSDFILIGAIVLAVGLIVFSLYFFWGRKGEKAVVTLDGTLIFEQELDKDCSLPITSENGTNTFVIKDGYAYVEEADCPDQICVNHKAVNKKGESIVCLPHKLIVEIE